MKQIPLSYYVFTYYQGLNTAQLYTDKKENQILLIYKETQSKAVAKSYMKKGFLIYEECANISPHMRRPLVIHDFATAPFWISLCMRKIWFSFLLVYLMCVLARGVSEWVEDVFSPSDNISGLEAGISVAVNVLEVKKYVSNKGWGVASC